MARKGHEACHDTLDCIVIGGMEGLKEARFVSQYTYVYCDRQGSQAAGFVSRQSTGEGHDTAVCVP